MLSPLVLVLSPVVLDLSPIVLKKSPPVLDLSPSVLDLSPLSLSEVFDFQGLHKDNFRKEKERYQGSAGNDSLKPLTGFYR